ncbi:hypothetical protein [Pseudonocardia sp. GCM10023141]|uniref:hypothetical protein n=1 Tax=Pseudonocardia sp. GCM10023141 TaxID=3252653 RepID=UPI00360E33A2
MFGIATWRARLVPVGIAPAMVVGGALAFHSGLPPYGLGLGLAVAAAGGWVIYRDRADRPVVATRLGRAPPCKPHAKAAATPTSTPSP